MLIISEPKPPRPADGPAAEITYDLPSSFFDDVHKMVNESENYPDTELLEQNANGASSLMDNNKDYFTKYREPCEKHFAPPTWSSNENDGPPVRPPRLQKSARLHSKLQHAQLSLSKVSDQQQPNANQALYSINEHDPHQQQQKQSNIEVASATASNNLPKISLLMNATSSSIDESTNNSSIVFGDSIPNLSFLRGNSNRNIETSDDIYSSNSIPNIIFANSSNLHRSSSATDGGDSNVNHELPAISALNLYGERDVNGLGPMGSVEYVPSVALNFNATNSSNSNANIGYNVPTIVANIEKDENLKHPNNGAIEVKVNGGIDAIDFCYDRGDDDNYDDDIGEVQDDEDDDDDDVPNLSMFNDSSLTSVTNTSGDNSFEHIVSESRPASADSAPNVFN